MKTQYDITKYNHIIVRGFLIGFFTSLFILILASCTVYKQPQMKITSVLAVTAEGDTLMLPIDVIRPIYNYNTYPTSRYPIGYGHNNFYYSPHFNRAPFLAHHILSSFFS